jgi:CTP synthase (UTP-ammonia lyase)
VSEVVSIGMIGDYDPASLSHGAVIAALGHAADYLSLRLEVCWLPTESMLELEYKKELEQFAGLWAAPGSPYRSMDGALRGIQYARETARPFFGT